MSRKHFKAIAEIISHYDIDNDMVKEFSNWLSKENANFDFYRFQEACKRYI